VFPRGFQTTGKAGMLWGASSRLLDLSVKANQPAAAAAVKPAFSD